MKTIGTPILLFAIFISSCSPAPYRLTKRYKSITLIQNDSIIKEKINVNVYGIPIEQKQSSKPKTVFDLAPKAQAAFITELAKKEAATDRFISSITNSLSPKTSPKTEVIDYSQFEKRINVSIRNNRLIEADRITKIKITLDFGNNIKILSCNKLLTEYETIDIGSLNYSNIRSTKVGGNVSLGMGKESTTGGEGSSGKTSNNTGIGLTGEYVAERSFSEEVLLKQRIVALNAAISQNKLSLYQDGITGKDLTGNIAADLVFRADDLKVEKTYSFSELIKNNLPNTANDIKVREAFIIMPNITDDIKANISFEAHYRNVIGKHNTISESDDKVNLYYGTVQNDQAEVIIPKHEIRPDLWKLTFQNIISGAPVEIKSPTAVGSGDLLFASFKEAKEFALWLKSKFDNSKTSIEISADNYLITMPRGFTTTQNMLILPYN